MKRWGLIVDGRIDTVTIQELDPELPGLWVAPVPAEFGPGDYYDEVAGYSKAERVSTVSPCRITQLAFDLRLTSEERKAIRAAAKVNEDVDDAYRLKEKATYIDLTAQITHDLVGVMVMAQCIAPERMPVILDPSTVSESDYYRGPI